MTFEERIRSLDLTKPQVFFWSAVAETYMLDLDALSERRIEFEQKSVVASAARVIAEYLCEHQDRALTLRVETSRKERKYSPYSETNYKPDADGLLGGQVLFKTTIFVSPASK